MSNNKIDVEEIRKLKRKTEIEITNFIQKKVKELQNKTCMEITGIEVFSIGRQIINERKIMIISDTELHISI